MAEQSVLEELLMEIQATAMKGVETDSVTTQVRAMFVRITKAAFFAQSARRGIRALDGGFNENLLRLMGEVN
jgi:hypothetical protein